MEFLGSVPENTPIFDGGRRLEGFSYFVTSIAAPVASGWSRRRVGLAPTGKASPFHGAHPEPSSTGSRVASVVRYTKELVELARGRTDDVGDLFKRVGGKNSEVDPHALAMWLRRIEGRHVDGKRLFRDTSDKARPRWILEQVAA
jgi:hypothetical protein